jgi:hypothetical protein
LKEWWGRARDRRMGKREKNEEAKREREVSSTKLQARFRHFALK